MIESMPKAPDGYACCRVGRMDSDVQTSHLVISDRKGFHGPTLCGLTRFPHRDLDTYAVIRPADLPGWSMNGGVAGLDVAQYRCPTCWGRA